MAALPTWLTAQFLYNIAKDSFTAIRGSVLSPAQKLALRERWKQPFADEIYRCRREKLRQDVIIRDVRRLDEYPETLDRRGISPWFRAALVGQYHAGIEVALGIHGLIWQESESAWRLSNYDIEADLSESSYLIGYIPYHGIVSVDFDGDEYYNFPQIFCKFQFGREPYERKAFCRRGSISTGHEFFTELGSYANVRLTSQKFGTSKFLWSD